MLIAVAFVAVLMVPLAEESYRRHLVAYHAEQQLMSEQTAGELWRQGQAARAAGRPEEAERSFASFNYWNERATGHLRMQKVYGSRWWLFGR
jgi:hypothetical protein